MMGNILSKYKTVSKLATIDEKIAFIEFCLGYYLWDHSRIIDVNYNEKWYRIVVFELIWGAIIKI